MQEDFHKIPGLSRQESKFGGRAAILKPPRSLRPDPKLAPSGWFGVALLVSFLVFAVSAGLGTAKGPLLTQAEKEWLAAHPEITIAPDPAYPPVEYFDPDGHYQGIAADYVRLVEQKLGISFRIARLENWDEAITRAKRREIDMFGAAAMTPQRSEYMLFTTPFVMFPSVIIVRKNVTASLSLEKLANMRVAIVSGYADHDYVVNNYPQLDLDVVPTVETGVRKVSFGMVDALVANLGAATYFIEKQGIANLRVAGNTGYVYRLGFGCRSDWPELAAILEKALSEITPDEREAIFKKWINLEHGESVHQHPVLGQSPAGFWGGFPCSRRHVLLESFPEDAGKPPDRGADQRADRAHADERGAQIGQCL